MARARKVIPALANSRVPARPPNALAKIPRVEGVEGPKFTHCFDGHTVNFVNFPSGEILQGDAP